MNDIKDVIPGKSKTASKVLKEWGNKSNDFREHLGASLLGDDCTRRLWFTFRWAKQPDFPGRIRRLFDRGNIEEPRVVEDLESIGCEVYDTNEHGNQFAVEWANGHCGGHLDGCVLGVPEAPKTWHVLEIKTHSAKNYRRIEEKGVKKYKFRHWVQCQIYMFKTGMQRALYYYVNKNTSDINTCRIRLDEEKAQKYIDRGESIVKMSNPPERVYNDKQEKPCKYCDYNMICYPEKVGRFVKAEVNCRTCAFSKPVLDSEISKSWECALNSKSISKNKQKSGCNDHLFIPEFIPFSESIEFQPGEYARTLYLSENNVEFCNGQKSDDNTFTSNELTAMNYASILGQDRDKIEDIRKTFKAKGVK